jgi:hypothetical protein
MPWFVDIMAISTSHDELTLRHRLGKTKPTLSGQKERLERNFSPKGS